MIKFLLKKIQPSPTKTFNGEMQQLYNIIEKEKKRQMALLKIYGRKTKIQVRL